MLLNLDKLGNALGRVSGYAKLGVDLVSAGSKTQEPARTALVDELQGVCDNVEEAVGAFSAALRPLRRALAKPDALARLLIDFDRDGSLRRAFKPEGLCREVDHLLVSTRSWLSATRWTWGVAEMELLRAELTSLQNLDAELSNEFDRATDELRRLGMAIAAAPKSQRDDKVVELSAFLATIERPLKECAARVRSAKNAISRGNR